MAHETGWTDRRVATLRREWGGDMSAREIGEAIGMSKSAVLGKARRIGLADSPIKRDPVANTNRRPSVRIVAPPSKQIALADMTQHQCRYPYGDRPADIRFCGHPVMERGDWRTPYCGFHQGRCYIAPEKRARAKQSTNQNRGRLSLAIPT